MGAIRAGMLGGLAACAAIATLYPATAHGQRAERGISPAQAPGGLLGLPLKPAPEPAPPAPSAATPAPQSPPTDLRRTVRRRLSNERTLSTWGYVRRRVVARRSPSQRSQAIKRLQTVTADVTPELVFVLSELRRTSGGHWLRVRLPMRPNGRTGWIPRSALGRLYRVRTLLRISRGGMSATLYRRGRPVWRAPVGIGRAATPTPRGNFYVRERLVPTNPDLVYGVFAFGTSAYAPTLSDWPGGGVVGIHGTNQPELVPGRISHGCVRVRNGAMSRLRQLMPLGTPIRID